MWIENSLLVQRFPLKKNRNRTNWKGEQTFKEYDLSLTGGIKGKKLMVKARLRDWWGSKGR